MILSNEDVEFIQFSKKCLDKGMYSSTKQLTEVYNRVFADRPNFRPIANTNCGSCIRHRIGELYGEMTKVFEGMESS